MMSAKPIRCETKPLAASPATQVTRNTSHSTLPVRKSRPRARREAYREVPKHALARRRYFGRGRPEWSLSGEFNLSSPASMTGRSRSVNSRPSIFSMFLRTRSRCSRIRWRDARSLDFTSASTRSSTEYDIVRLTQLNKITGEFPESRGLAQGPVFAHSGPEPPAAFRISEIAESVGRAQVTRNTSHSTLPVRKSRPLPTNRLVLSQR